MKTLLYTGHDKAYAPLAAITVPRMAEYAERHGFDFTCYTEPIIDVPNGIYWTGVCGALKAFEDGYDQAIYLDVDQLVTNFNYRVPAGNGFHISKDWGVDATGRFDVSACGFAIGKEASRVASLTIDLESEWREKPFPEQGPLRYVIEKISHESLSKNQRDPIFVHHRGEFNCVPEEVCPGNVVWPWWKDCWCAHLTMVDLNRRIEIAKEILKNL